MSTIGSDANEEKSTEKSTRKAEEFVKSTDPDEILRTMQTKHGIVDKNRIFGFGSFPGLGTHHQQNMGLMENCAIKSVFSGVMGGGLGLLFGLFMGSMDASHTRPELDKPDMPLKEALRQSWKKTKANSKSYAKSFGGIGFLYSGVECLVEKQRGTHEKNNAVIAGCITGGLLACQAGPGAMAMGCGGFAAFSYAIETYMES